MPWQLEATGKLQIAATQNHINKEYNPLETVTFFNILLTVTGQKQADPATYSS